MSVICTIQHFFLYVTEVRSLSSTDAAARPQSDYNGCHVSTIDWCNLKTVDAMQRRSMSDVKSSGDVAMVEEDRDSGRRKSARSDAADVRRWNAGDEHEYLPLTVAAARRPAAVTSTVVDDQQRCLDVRRCRQRRTVIDSDQQPTDRRCTNTTVCELVCIDLSLIHI